jgi:4-amino-4-deoxy-L-arabinose transferase-like glycosyltransferase
MTGINRSTIVLFSLWIAVTLLNVTKAVHIDDPTYLLIARHILDDPLHPMSGTLVLSGSTLPIPETNQPHLLLYGFAAVMAAFGESEIALHLFISLFSAAAIVFFHRLARIFCPSLALLLTATFCLGPAFLPGQNLMTDVPMVALWLCFFWILVKGMDDRSPSTGYLAAAAIAGTACLVKYTSLVLLPLLLIPFLFRRDWRSAWVLLVPLGILVAWSAFNYFDYGEIHLLSRSPSERGDGSVAERLLNWIQTLGAIAPFSILYLSWARRRKLPAFAVLLAVLLTALLAPVSATGAPFLQSLLGRAFLANGVLVVLATALSLGTWWPQHREQALLLAAWIAAGAAFVVAFAPFMAVRHVLPVIPAVLLASGRLCDARGQRGWMASACALTAALGIALGVSDWSFADQYRSQARALRERFGSETRIWYLCNWGWRWYAEAEGMRPYLGGETELRSADIVVIPEVAAGPKRLARSDESRIWLRDAVPVPATPTTRLRTMRPQPLGGYYGFHPGGLPWSVSSQPLERFRILRVGGFPE